MDSLSNEDLRHSIANLNQIGYEIGDTILDVHQDDFRENPQNNKLVSMMREQYHYTPLRKFLVKVAGFVRKNVKDLMENDEDTEKELLKQVKADIQQKIKDYNGKIESLIRDTHIEYLPWCEIEQLLPKEKKNEFYEKVKTVNENRSNMTCKDGDCSLTGQNIDAGTQTSECNEYQKNIMNEFIILLKPEVVSAIAMAKLKIQNRAHCTWSLDDLMDSSKNQKSDISTYFAYLVSLQYKMASYDNPQRYLTKDHITNYHKAEKSLLRRLKHMFSGSKKRATLFTGHSDALIDRLF